MSITIKNSNAAVYETASLISKAVGAMLPVLPYSLRSSIYEWAYFKESEIATHRHSTGNYPERTWFGLNGVDQYDLLADFVMLNAYKFGGK